LQTGESGRSGKGKALRKGKREKGNMMFSHRGKERKEERSRRINYMKNRRKE